MIKFSRHNLLSDKPMNGMDIIFCRNVFIYFNMEVTRNVLSAYHNCLNRDGYLFLGNSEIVEDYFFCHFKKIKKHGEFIYKKIEQGSAEHKEMVEKQMNIKAGLGIV